MDCMIGNFTFRFLDHLLWPLHPPNYDKDQLATATKSTELEYVLRAKE